MIIGTNGDIKEDLSKSSASFKYPLYQWMLEQKNMYFTSTTFDMARQWYDRIKPRNIVQIIHAPLTLSLASPNPRVHKPSASSLRQFMHIAEKMGAAALVAHVGSHKSTPEEGWARVEQFIPHILEGTKSIELVFENAAGGGTSLASDIFHMASIIKKYDRVKICLDTAHWWIAGQMTPENVARLKDIEDQILVLHANASDKEEGSHWDRHAGVTFDKSAIPRSLMLNTMSTLSRDNKLWVLERSDQALVDQDIAWLKTQGVTK